MFYYLVRRLVSVVVMLVLITGTTFALFFASPLDPAKYTCGRNCTPSIASATPKAAAPWPAKIRAQSIIPWP